MAIERNSQSSLEQTEWDNFVDAIDELHQPSHSPNFQDFVNIHLKAMARFDHTGHAWGVHTMFDHYGRNFLAWHREYLLRLEEQLRSINSSVSIPYWDWTIDRDIPPQISKLSQLQRWGVRRQMFPPLSQLPTASQVKSVTDLTDFALFQRDLERLHGAPHNVVGGNMTSASSPKDPIFWLHHANVDRLWSKWQTDNPGKNPNNEDEKLEPGPIIMRKVKELLDITALGYEYI